MKKVITTIFLGVATMFSFSQNWSQGGNPNTGFQPILGTNNTWNNHLLFHTNGLNRMKLNSNVSYDINGATGTNMSREGYLLLGQNTNFNNTANPIYKKGAFSLLHLNGYNSTGVDELGYRNWMQTGITLTGNHDLLRSLEC